MIEIGSRARRQAPPPHVVYQSLLEPDRDPSRPWLVLLGDEQPPVVLSHEAPQLVVWSSLWKQRADAVIRFELAGDADGTELRWTVSVEQPVPSDVLVGHIRFRMNQLINANLRFTFGQ